MGIQALPQTTVRALGASQVLTDPAALVKELVDNALDANATSIAVEIHSNTVDIIQVRDNGHGVAPEDRPLVARRYCTSKISDDEDLKHIGGTSLGFRGEALASAAELSNSMTISTRIEGEQVAVALKINQQGEIAGQDRASLPVGTTVRIIDFLEANPVRRQVVLKNAENCMKKIKRMLQAYAFARLRVRLSLRVLKAKNTKGDWVYAPKPGGNAEDAAYKIVGASCASQCIWSAVEDRGFTLQAFLPRPDVAVSKISNIGTYLSVDRRPVSSIRGTFKHVVKAFREALKRQSLELSEVKDPFLFLTIDCPQGSYDANIEPAKDDVLFEDSNHILDAAKKMFTAVYNQPETPKRMPVEHCDDQLPEEIIDQAVVSGMVEEPDGFTTSLEIPAILKQRSSSGNEGRVSAAYTATIESREDVSRYEEASVVVPQTFRTTMYGCDEEDVDLLDTRPPTEHTEADFEELRQAKNDVNVSNPWVLAKLNSTVRRSPVDLQESLARQAGTGLVCSNSLPKRTTGSIVSGTDLPTPGPSSPLNEEFCDLPGIEPNVSSGTRLEAITKVGRPRRSPPKQGRASGINKPFVIPLPKQPRREKVWFDHLENVSLRSRLKDRGARQQGNGLVSPGELGDLIDDPRFLTPPRRNRDIRDFVGRNDPIDDLDAIAAMIEVPKNGQHAQQAATLGNENIPIENEQQPAREVTGLAGRGFVSASKLAALTANASSPEKQARHPPKRRKTSGRHALETLSTNAPVGGNIIEEDDSRSETACHTLSTRRRFNKLSRTKSSRLLLERTPTGEGVQNIVHYVTTSSQDVYHLASKLDKASLLGFNEPALEHSRTFADVDLQDLTNDLHNLLVKVGSDSDAEPRNLFRELSEAFVQHDMEV